MKYQKILGLVATAGLLLAGCATDSDNNNTWLSDSNAVHVSASVGSIFTRSYPTDETKQTSFNNGDVMGVSNNGKSLTYTFNGTDWQPKNGTDYLVWDSDLTFQCWYPADGKNSFSKGYVLEDQSDAEKIAESDYMTAEKKLDAIPDSRKLEVALERKTARLILNIQSFNDQFDAKTTKVNHIRMASKASTDAGETSIVNIKPLQNGEGGIGTTYTALVIPGAVEGKLYFTDNESAETPLVVKTGTLEAGKSYTYNLTVGKNTITVNDVTVAEWGTDKIEGGKAEVIPYVTFTAEAEQKFKMTTTGDYDLSGKFQYSVNEGKWENVVKDEEVTFGGTNGNLRLRGINKNGTATDDSNYSTITFTDDNVKVACTGDIRTLLDYKTYKTVDTSNARFCYLFIYCKVLTSAPQLPATTLASNCYDSMFRNCTNLTSAPKLPATTLADDCYREMFYGCSNLSSAPKLPATTLADYCYSMMFYGCSNLSSVTMLAPSDQISRISFTNWLHNAGTTATSRTLIVKDKDAYEATKGQLPTEWQIGHCTVLAGDNSTITE
ncbi:fimbrillin family protein [Segatella copri]|uniref:fimbrillin family protein n=1 Tax=Segatella copri TaxID=165179 RepID=UPI001C451860|nr:fimbrillin family protein [Segatella copri]MBW0049805.1 fimbrillin family protein [Segatella copri]